MLFYRAALPLSSRALTYASGIIRRHMVAAGSRWRKLNPERQALLVLVYLRKGETFAELAAGVGVGTATAWRYVNETMELLSVRAPKLRTAVRDAKRKGHAYVVVDGTLIPSTGSPRTGRSRQSLVAASRAMPPIWRSGLPSDVGDRARRSGNYAASFRVMVVA